MSAKSALKVIPGGQRLRVTARYAHETVQYGGNIFEFIDQLMKEGRTGRGTFRLNQGRECGLEFDFREKVPEIVVDNTGE